MFENERKKDSMGLLSGQTGKMRMNLFLSACICGKRHV